MPEQQAITLEQLNQRIRTLITCADTQNVWVTAELSDVAPRGGHYYMELLQKDNDGRNIVARSRAMIWANRASSVISKFEQATNQRFATGIKVMVCVSASMHPVFGLSVVINDINPEFTLGDLMRRRQEILNQLQQDGVINDNRQLQWPAVAQRIAIISAQGAAGYGDFINQLFGNNHHLRFNARLFPAVMQGERSPESIINALNAIAQEQDEWDCVVIIRGGGASADLASFEHYELALNIAQFPLPVVIGIGHERDITVLDYVANMRVKTPTAAAQWLISKNAAVLEQLQQAATNITLAVTERINGCKTQLSHIEGIIPSVARIAIERGKNSLQRNLLSLSAVSNRIVTSHARLDNLALMLRNNATSLTTRASDSLAATERLLNALSPQATLNRGYSITRINGKAVTAATQLKPGDVITTQLADGQVTSTINQ